MIALTARLNERDEMIMRLQEEVDAYDKHQRDLEDALDQKTAGLIHAQRVALEQADSPEKKAMLANRFAAASDMNEATSSGAGSNGSGGVTEVSGDIFTARGVGPQGAVMDRFLQEKLESLVQAEVDERINDLKREVFPPLEIARAPMEPSSKRTVEN
jgi:hypothetical protein